MNVPNETAQETSQRQEFRNNVRLLDGISSWHVWTSGLVLLLSSVATLLLFDVTPAVVWGLRGLLGLVSIVSGTFLYQQRLRLALVRKNLIAQIDATARAHATADKFQGMATTDALTGLHNRRFGETRLKEEIERAEKSGEPLLLVAVDFDKFKQINDTYGHAAGDEALKAFSRRLQKAIRACDVPIRMGGDEFLVIFPDCPSDRFSTILSRLDSIAFDFAGKQIPVTFSHGMAQFEFGDTPEKMIQRADARLYASKAARKSAVVTGAARIPADEATAAHSRAVQGSTLTAQVPSDEPLSKKSDDSAPAAGEANVTADNTLSLAMGALFRRSKRVECDISVAVQVPNPNGTEEPGVQEGKTLNVSAHGALLALNTPIEIGQKVRLVNPRTQQEIDCCVRRLVVPTPNGPVQVGVEFVAVAPTFWDVASPPSDWDPAWRPAPERLTNRSLNPENPGPLPPSRDDANKWGNDVYVSSISQPLLEPAWIHGREGQPMQASPSANAGSAETWADLDDVIHKALKELDTLPLNRPLREKPKGWRPAHKKFALGLILALCCIVLILLIVPGKSAARRDSATPSNSSRSERADQSDRALPSKPDSSASPGEPKVVSSAERAGQVALPTEVARVIPDVADFRLATTEDFDPAGVSWLRTQGQQVDAQIPGNYTGSGDSSAYILRGKDKSWRVLIVGDGQVYCDVRYRDVAVAARVPKESIRNIQWNGPAAPQFDGDGLLIVRSAGDPASGVILSLHGGDMSGSHPVDYRQNPIK